MTRLLLAYLLLFISLAGCHNGPELPEWVATATSVSPASTDYALTAYTAPGVQRSALDRLHIKTNSSELLIEQTEAVFARNPEYAGTSVFTADGTYIGTVLNDSAGTQRRTIRLPNTDSTVQKEYILIESTQQRYKDEGLRLGGQIEKIFVPKGMTISIVSPTHAPVVAVLIVDSTGSGIGSEVPQRDAWPELLEQEGKTDFICDGYGNMSVTKSLGTDSLIDAEVLRVQQLTAKATKKEVFIQLAANDLLGNLTTAERFAQQESKLVEALHQADPQLAIIVATPFVFKNEGGMPAFRTAIMSQAAKHPYAQYVDGKALADASLLAADGVHWSTAGQQQQAQRIKAVLHL